MGANETSLYLWGESAQRLSFSTPQWCAFTKCFMHQQMAAMEVPSSELPSRKLGLENRADQQSTAAVLPDPPRCSCQATLPRAFPGQWLSTVGVLYSIPVPDLSQRSLVSGTPYLPGWNLLRTMPQTPSCPCLFIGVRPAPWPEGCPCLPLLPPHFPPWHFSKISLHNQFLFCLLLFRGPEWHTIYKQLLFCMYIPFSISCF